MLWVDKYSPKSLAEVKGNKFALDRINSFILNFKKEKKKSLILVGPTGTGKTACVYAFGKENNYEILELNASDFRDKQSVEEFMNPAMTQMSLFMRPKIILIDEIDGFSGIKDRGGAQALTNLIDKTEFPIIMTSNDITLDKLSGLVKKSDILDFEELQSSQIAERLIEILEKEKLGVDDFLVRSIASRSGGDLRAAINDLQTIYSGYVNRENLDLIGERKREEELNNILTLIFKSKDITLIENSLEDINLDELGNWVSRNVPLEYKPLDVAKAMDSLSKADRFKGRIIRWQYWRFLVYQKFFLSSGVALSKEEKNKKVIMYKRPDIGLMVWQANMKNVKRKSISEKLAEPLGLSKKRAFQIFPEIRFLIKSNKIQEKLNLDDEEISWIKNKLL